jgi:predicted small lipoprotein YifL
MRSLVCLLLVSAVLQGCGLKGPLYLPTAAETREMADRKKRLEERSEKERQDQPPQTPLPGDAPQ